MKSKQLWMPPQQHPATQEKSLEMKGTRLCICQQVSDLHVPAAPHCIDNVM